MVIAPRDPWALCLNEMASWPTQRSRCLFPLVCRAPSTFEFFRRVKSRLHSASLSAYISFLDSEESPEYIELRLACKMTDVDVLRRNVKPRLLLESEREKLEDFIDSIHYSARYSDNEYEYRHVQLPKNMLKKIPDDYFDKSKGTLKLLWEEEWRGLGITQSLGWEHYEVHEPEPHILLFKRPINYQPPTTQ